MKICAAQLQPEAGKIDHNIRKHLLLIERAVAAGADCIVFPELSVTGYEPEIVQELAKGIHDAHFDIFQQFSNEHTISICIGMPTSHNGGVLISMLIFQPRQPRQIYSKRYLHEDEIPYFIPGNQPFIFTIKNHSIAPAICYESLLVQHAEQVIAMGAGIYLASVAKPQRSLDKAFLHYSTIAKKYSMPVVMANSLGPSDNFVSAGQSAVWNAEGELLGKLDDANEGIIVFDTSNEKIDLFN